MTAPAAISGTFADYRLVKSRSVLQLVIEIPVERQAEAFATLGYPVPGTDIHVALARLVTGKEKAAEQARSNKAQAAASQRGKERYANSTPMAQALVRACRLTDDLRFQQWVADQTACPATSDQAAAFLRASCCGGRSRGLIAEDPESYQRYIALETEWKIVIGEMAAPR